MKLDTYRVRMCGAELAVIYNRMAELAKQAAPLNDQLAHQLQGTAPMSAEEAMIRDLVLGRPGEARFTQLAILANAVSNIRISDNVHSTDKSVLESAMRKLHSRPAELCEVPA